MSNERFFHYLHTTSSFLYLSFKVVFIKINKYNNFVYFNKIVVEFYILPPFLFTP